MIRSPTTLPIAPKNAVLKIPWRSDISPSAAMAGAVVNIDVKNIPAIKAPKTCISPADTRRLESTLVRTRSTATSTLSTMRATSCRI